MGPLQLHDLRHTLVDTGTTLLCISGYNGLPGPILPINLIHETARRSERVDNAALSSAVSLRNMLLLELAMGLCFSIAVLVFFTTFTNVMSFAELSLLELVCCCFLPLQLAQIQLVLLLFGIRLKPIHDKWKYLPYLQSELWHSSSLSLSLGLLLHMQHNGIHGQGRGRCAWFPSRLSRFSFLPEFWQSSTVRTIPCLKHTDNLLAGKVKISDGTFRVAANDSVFLYCSSAKPYIIVWWMVNFGGTVLLSIPPTKHFW